MGGDRLSARTHTRAGADRYSKEKCSKVRSQGVYDGVLISYRARFERQRLEEVRE